MKKILLPFITSIFMFCLITTVNAQNSNTSNSQPQNDDEKYYNSTEVDQKIKIISKPIPKTDGKCNENSGEVSLRVYFNKSGKIDKTEFVRSSPCTQFNENAKSAAKRIKFKPAEKDGQPVSYTTLVQYNWKRL